MIQTITAWLASCPELAGMEILTDALPWRHGCAGVFPEGTVERSRREDILGNVTLRSRQDVTLALCLEKAPGQDCPENAERLQRLAKWTEQTAPIFGENQHFRAQKGRLKTANNQGLARYDLTLTWEYDENQE